MFVLYQGCTKWEPGALNTDTQQVAPAPKSFLSIIVHGDVEPFRSVGLDLAAITGVPVGTDKQPVPPPLPSRFSDHVPEKLRGGKRTYIWESDAGPGAGHGRLCFALGFSQVCQPNHRVAILSFPLPMAKHPILERLRMPN